MFPRELRRSRSGHDMSMQGTLLVNLATCAIIRFPIQLLLNPTHTTNKFPIISIQILASTGSNLFIPVINFKAILIDPVGSNGYPRLYWINRSMCMFRTRDILLFVEIFIEIWKLQSNSVIRSTLEFFTVLFYHWLLWGLEFFQLHWKFPRRVLIK